MIKREVLHLKILDELELIYSKLLSFKELDIESIENLYLERENLISILKKSNFRSKSDKEKSLFKNLMSLDNLILIRLDNEMSLTAREIKSHHLIKKTHQAYLKQGRNNGKS